MPNLLDKFNSIQENKILLSYLILMEGLLMSIVYNHKQKDLKDECVKYLKDLKTDISKDAKKIVEETVRKYNSEFEPTNKKTKTEEGNLKN